MQRQLLASCFFTCFLIHITTADSIATATDGSLATDDLPFWTNEVNEEDFPDTTNYTRLREEFLELSKFEDLNPREDSPKPRRVTYAAVGKISPEVLSNAMTKLWMEDVNRYEPSKHFAVNTQTKLVKGKKNPRSAGKLYTAFDPRILQGTTYRTLTPLLDNYNPMVGKREVYQTKEIQEMGQFLEAIVNTNVMKLAAQFLSNYGYVPKDKKSFKEYLYDIWFTLYSRQRGVLDSCGFEHVFVGEWKNGEVSGLHNWIRLYHLQRQNKLDYRGVFYTKAPNLLSMQFKWMNYLKETGSVFMGTSPEFEMAMITICFLVRPNGACEFTIKNRRVKLITYQMNQGNRRARVGTAFPI